MRGPDKSRQIVDQGGRLRRMKALIRKEMLQIVRDPSSLVVARLASDPPPVSLRLRRSFDVTKFASAWSSRTPTPETVMFVASLSNTPFFNVRVSHDRRAFLDDLRLAHRRRSSILPGDFTQRIGRGDTAAVQIITDGSDPNTASLVTAYVQGAWQSWLSQRALSNGIQVHGRITDGAARLVQSRARKPALSGARLDRADSR